MKKKKRVTAAIFDKVNRQPSSVPPMPQQIPTRLLIMKGLFTKEEFLDMVKVVDHEIKRNKR